MVHAPGETTLLDGLARDVLHEWAEHGQPTPDPGPVVLASTLPPDDPAVARAARAWLAGLRRTANGHPGLFGGLAGHLVGLRLLAVVHPPLERAADAVATALHSAVPRSAAADPGEGFGFRDYDLVGGPAGVLLAHCVPAARPGELDAHATRLAALCANGAGGLRCTAYEGHEALAWMQGRVNAGLAHGVPGVVVALAAALRAGAAGPEVADALRLLGRWLVAEARCDPRGIVTWPVAGGGSAPTRSEPRQAWCYGCPGVAWALWEAGVVLREPGFTALGVTAIRSLCANHDESFHLYGDTASDRLGLCHGAAGVLAVADAFATHAGLPRAGALRRRLADHLRAHGDEVVDLARADMSVLTGAAGLLAALRTASGASRAWLPVIGLR
ncbi:lanthionine synthetase LanC family protein [Saccharothrix sp. HUAS TT1]|uniref:lanthionine synthetase LanC family protein n=1 Tax=unclassified Saccharothrix TaxID=2593673 RepID=UPI00345C15E7